MPSITTPAQHNPTRNKDHIIVVADWIKDKYRMRYTIDTPFVYDTATEDRKQIPPDRMTFQESGGVDMMDIHSIRRRLVQNNGWMTSNQLFDDERNGDATNG